MSQPRVVIDLTDEEGLLAEDFAHCEPRGMRARLAALNLKTSGRGDDDDEPVFDRAVYRATRDRRLATLFGSAR